ncbi:hypothetical protein LZ32DRAFT_429335 [Colletotrichum eremochloae]|nr:hypothetical protein LZ32DRAFT_429335 [Colletotrichum eremochloae]
MTLTYLCCSSQGPCPITTLYYYHRIWAAASYMPSLHAPGPTCCSPLRSVGFPISNASAPHYIRTSSRKKSDEGL